VEILRLRWLLQVRSAGQQRLDDPEDPTFGDEQMATGDRDPSSGFQRHLTGNE
jgi:hypothetical protein